MISFVWMKTILVGYGPCNAQGMPLGSYLVATSYGSAVFFNVDAEGKEKWLEVLKSTATEPLAGEKKYHEGEYHDIGLHTKDLDYPYDAACCFTFSAP